MSTCFCHLETFVLLPFEGIQSIPFYLYTTVGIEFQYCSLKFCIPLGLIDVTMDVSSSRLSFENSSMFVNYFEHRGRRPISSLTMEKDSGYIFFFVFFLMHDKRT